MRVSLPAIHSNPLPYASLLQARSTECIDLAVIHCTELPDLAMAREFGERILYPESSTGNSGHYYVERSGSIQEWVPPQRVAHHVRGYNARSIGIELVNLGRYPDWFDSRCQQMKEPYPQAQIDALVTLLQELGRILPALRWIAGHEVLDASKVAATDTSGQLISRKRDPGPLFPWSRVLAAIGLQYLQGEALDGYQPD
jgi:N-acetylmuramoyl-L-alanine amidase